MQTPPFDGATYDAEIDGARLGSQLERVRDLMLDGTWRTIPEIRNAVRRPDELMSEASISARLRDLRKEKFGGYVVEHRRVRESGLWEYRVLPPEPNQQQTGVAY